jgi:hypothetical protein
MHKWMRLFPGSGDFEHRFELDAAMTLDVANQTLEHEQTMAAADYLRMHRERIYAFADMVVKIIEVAGPDFVYRRRRRAARLSADKSRRYGPGRTRSSEYSPRGAM